MSVATLARRAGLRHSRGPADAVTNPMQPTGKLTPEQAEAAAAAILAGPEAAAMRAQTEALRRRLASARRSRDLASGALLGFVAGAAVGSVAFDAVMPAGIVGLGLGALAARLLAARRGDA